MININLLSEEKLTSLTLPLFGTHSLKYEYILVLVFKLYKPKYTYNGFPLNIVMTAKN